MKVNVSFEPNPIAGYHNHVVMESGAFDLVNFDDGEVTEIYAPSIIEYIPRQFFDNVLGHWISKLSHNGKLILSFDDAYTVARKFFLQQISFQEYNFLTQGEMKYDWQDKKVNMTVPQLCDTLQKIGLKIVNKKLNEHRAVIIGQRP